MDLTNTFQQFFNLTLDYWFSVYVDVSCCRQSVSYCSHLIHGATGAGNLKLLFGEGTEVNVDISEYQSFKASSDQMNEHDFLDVHGDWGILVLTTHLNNDEVLMIREVDQMWIMCRVSDWTW